MVVYSVHGYIPVIDTLFSSDDIILTTGSSKQITCNATVIDSDGVENLTATAVFYDKTTANANSADDNNNHYSDLNCSAAGSGNQSQISCSFSLMYYANAGDQWICNMTVSDGSDNACNSSTNLTVEELTAFDITNISYIGVSGTEIDPGNLSAISQMNITNLGNTDFTVELSGTDLVCVQGKIFTENQRYNETPGFDWNTAQELRTDVKVLHNFIVPRQQDDSTMSIQSLYWRIQAPIDGAGGLCAGSITINAV